MGRPEPIKIMDIMDNDYNCTEVLASEAIWAVFFDGKPINIRRYVKDPMPRDNPECYKYERVSFPNPGYAMKKAAELNRVFHTNKFNVVKLVSGEIINEEEFRKKAKKRRNS